MSTCPACGGKSFTSMDSDPNFMSAFMHYWLHSPEKDFNLIIKNIKTCTNCNCMLLFKK